MGLFTEMVVIMVTVVAMLLAAVIKVEKTVVAVGAVDDGRCSIYLFKDDWFSKCSGIIVG